MAIDYNQSPDVPEALHRVRALADERLMRVEEPTAADDYLGHARIRAASEAPIQLGESWWGVPAMTAVGVSGWRG